MSRTASLGYLPALMFAQMLPATLVVPAIRPLFAAYHGGNEGAMHAFMAVNMVGAALVVPIVVSRLDRWGHPRRVFAALATLDAVLLAALAAPLPTAAILALRFLEGAAHVSAASILLAEAAGAARATSPGRAMGSGGAAIIAAVVAGSAIGGFVADLDPRAPFAAGALASLVAAAVSPLVAPRVAAPRAHHTPCLRVLGRAPQLWIPVTLAFVARFTVGCIVVTFALFAHAVHGLGDGAIGVLFSLMTLPFALAMYPAGRFTDRFGCARVLGGGLAVYAAALAAIGYAPSGALPAVMIAAGVASAMLFAAVLRLGAVLAPAGERTAAMGLVNVAGCLGMLLGPPAAAGISAAVGGAAGRATGYRAAFLLAAAAIVCWAVARRRWLASRWRAEPAEISVTGEAVPVHRQP